MSNAFPLKLLLSSCCQPCRPAQPPCICSPTDAQWAGPSPALAAIRKVAFGVVLLQGGVAVPAPLMPLASTQHHCAAVLRPALLQMCA